MVPVQILYEKLEKSDLNILNHEKINSTKI